MNKTIKELYGLDPVGAKNWAKATPQECPDTQLIHGIELEIENASADWVVAGMRVVRDESLRNNGLEFVTSPMTYSNMYHVLNTFFSKAPDINANCYSDRTSIHVHTNCLDLTPDQLATVCLLYQVFERLLYNFAGGERDKNIFCVPWSQANLTYNLINKIKSCNHTSRDWHKYTGLNLIPLFEQGSIEWRHMPGTNDINRIMIWLALIGSIYAYARTHSCEQAENMFAKLNTTSEYRTALESVFGKYTDHLRTGDYEQCIEDGVLHLKYALLTPSNSQKNNIDMNELIPPPHGEVEGAFAAHHRRVARAADVAVPRQFNWQPAPPARDPRGVRLANGNNELQAILDQLNAGIPVEER